MGKKTQGKLSQRGATQIDEKRSNDNEFKPKKDQSFLAKK